MSSRSRFAGWAVALPLMALGLPAFSADKTADLEKQLAAATDEYYALYNKLNADPQYDMVCRMERETGTKFEKRVCLPRYARDSQTADASQTMQSATQAMAPTNGVVASGKASTASSSKAEGYLNNMRAVLEKSPELLAIAQKRNALLAQIAESKAK